MRNILKRGYNEKYNITFRCGGLDVDIPSDKRILLLDGEYEPICNGEYGCFHNGEFYPPNSDAVNKTFQDALEYGLMGKIGSIEKMFPREKTIEESRILEEYEQMRYEMPAQEWRKAVYGYYRKLAEYIPDTAVWRKITFHDEKEMSIECFKLILEHAGNPSFVIVSNDFVYEHLPSIGCPIEIQTSEGIIEAWAISDTTMFYMPLTGVMSDEQIDLWRKVLSEILAN